MTDGDGTVPSGGAGRGGPLLLVFAHPDDETFGCAGVAALAAARGERVVLVSATRGEAGGASDEAPATRETIGAVRETELRAAMAAVGVDDVRFLGLRDSGMDGTPENDDPRAFVRVPTAEVVALLVAQIRLVRPRATVTFGPDGIYGHPDHLHVHRAAVPAVAAAADPAYLPAAGAPWRTGALYFSAVARERFRELAANPGDPFYGRPEAELAKLGVPEERITTVIALPGGVRAAKERAIRAHRTQVGEGGPMAGMSPERMERMLGTESFVRVPLPWDDPDALAPGLLEALADQAVAV